MPLSGKASRARVEQLRGIGGFPGAGLELVGDVPACVAERVRSLSQGVVQPWRELVRGSGPVRHGSCSSRSGGWSSRSVRRAGGGGAGEARAGRRAGRAGFSRECRGLGQRGRWRDRRSSFMSRERSAAVRCRQAAGSRTAGCVGEQRLGLGLAWSPRRKHDCGAPAPASCTAPAGAARRPRKCRPASRRLRLQPHRELRVRPRATAGRGLWRFVGVRFLSTLGASSSGARRRPRIAGGHLVHPLGRVEKGRAIRPALGFTALPDFDSLALSSH